MNLIFDLQDGSSFSLQAGLPPGYRGIVLQGAASASLQTSSELIVLQHFIRADFAIQLGIYKFLHLVRSILRPPAFPTGSLLVMRNDLKAGIEGIGPISLRREEFSFIHFANENILAEFEAGQEYHLLAITCSSEMLSQALPHFPDLAEVFLKANTQPDASLLTNPHIAGEKALDLVQDLLNSRFDPGVNEIYFEYKVREYVLLLLVESSKAAEPRIFLSKEEKILLQDLGARLQMNPRGKFPIAVLAKEMGMNEMKLKLAFKQLFGKAIFKFHLDQRMREARRLLKESGLPTKVIAGMVGYDLTTSFITQFKEYFGYPPSRIQKKF